MVSLETNLWHKFSASDLEISNTSNGCKALPCLQLPLPPTPLLRTSLLGSLDWESNLRGFVSQLAASPNPVRLKHEWVADSPSIPEVPDSEIWNVTQGLAFPSFPQ